MADEITQNGVKIDPKKAQKILQKLLSKKIII